MQQYNRNSKTPGYVLIFYGPSMSTWFVRGQPPTDESGSRAHSKLGLLKAIMIEGAIYSLIHDETSFEHFWQAVNMESNRQFQEIARYSTTLFMQIICPRFSYLNTAGSLSEHAIGQDVPALLMEEGRTSGKVFHQGDWEDLVDSIFQYFDLDLLPAQSWRDATRAQQAILRIYHQRSRARGGRGRRWDQAEMMSRIIERAQTHPLPEPDKQDWHTKCYAETREDAEVMTAALGSLLPFREDGAQGHAGLRTAHGQSSTDQAWR